MTVRIERHGDIARVIVDNPPVNALSTAVRQGLMDALVQTEADPAARAVVLQCAGRTFIAGADVREFGQPAREPHLPDVVAALETATKPWVAAIHGTALGGGLEIAMACSHRIAASDARLGLPEVNLGLIPGAGATVRLPRLVPADKALGMIADGKPLSANAAMKIGLVDRVAAGDLAVEAMEMASEATSQPLPKPLIARAPISPADAETFAAQKARILSKARGQLAPAEVVKAIDNALTLPADEALSAERETFLRLRAGEQSGALRHIFFAERSVSKIPTTEGATARPLETIGVIGGGTMGAGIASACLLAGLTVRLIERDEAACAAALDRVRGVLDGSRQRGLLNEDGFASAMDRMTVGSDYDALSDADLVIEAVFEDMDVKKAVFAELDRVTRPDAVLASNPSYLDVNEIARASADPSRVLGLHFFSPAHVMKLLELVVSDTAAPDVLATGLALGKKLRKITVPAGVCDGFIGNRIMSAYRRECDYMIEDGALPEQVDAAMTAFGFPMGIFAMQDLAGLDIAWAMRKRQAATRPADQRYVEIADRLCEQGRLGRKTGKGWYDYSRNKAGEPDPEVTSLIGAESARRGIARTDFTQEQIMERILGVMQREGAAILDEGIAQSADAIDVVMVNGYGFPRWKGGPMYLAAQTRPA